MKALTRAEEQVMQILWELEKGFVKDIIEQMPDPKPAYNTVSTIIRILEGKGFVDHKAYGKTYEYFPLISKKAYTGFAFKQLFKNYFGGSVKEMVSFFSEDQQIDLEEMESLLQHLQKNKKHKK